MHSATFGRGMFRIPWQHTITSSFYSNKQHITQAEWLPPNPRAQLITSLNIGEMLKHRITEYICCNSRSRPGWWSPLNSCMGSLELRLKTVSIAGRGNSYEFNTYVHSAMALLQPSFGTVRHNKLRINSSNSCIDWANEIFNRFSLATQSSPVYTQRAWGVKQYRALLQSLTRYIKMWVRNKFPSSRYEIMDLKPPNVVCWRKGIEDSFMCACVQKIPNQLWELLYIILE